MTKPTKSLCTQRRLRSAWASAQSDQSLHCVLNVKLSSCGQRRLWSDWADAQADLSLRWAYMSFCWFWGGSLLQYYRHHDNVTWHTQMNKSPMCHIWATSWENLFMPYANNKGADQPVHPRSLISAFVVRCLDSIIPLLAKLSQDPSQSHQLSRPVWVLPGWKPRRQIFSWRGSYCPC